MSIRFFSITCIFGLILLGCMNYVIAQSQIEKGSIQWKQINIYDPVSNLSRASLTFEQGKFKQDFPVAYVEEKFALQQNQAITEAYIANSVYEVVPEEEVSILKEISNISDTINIKIYTETENKQKYLIYSFLPIRKNKKSGNYERLTYYVLGFTEAKTKAFIQSAQVKTYLENSILQSGDWYKFNVGKSGVCQIFYSELKDLGLKNPEQVKIYGNGGGMLPEKFSGSEIDDIKEIPILMITGTDGVFNSGDYILFYAQGPVVWKWDHSKSIFNYSQHAFTNEITYFISSGLSGKKITTVDIPSGTPNNQVTTYDHYDFVENNLYNLIRSGREYYGEKFAQTTAYDFTFDFPNLVSGENIYLQSEVLSQSPEITSYTFNYNNVAFTSTIIPISKSQYTANTVQGIFSATPGKIKITVKYDKNNVSTAEGYLNYIKIWGRQNLKINGYQLSFRDTRSVAVGNISNYIIDGATNLMLVWDITDLNDVKQYSTTLQNNKLSFVASSETLHNYVVFDSKSGLIRPELKSENKIANQNLHALKNIDFVIFTHPTFINQARDLAELHRNTDGLSVSVVTTTEVYNEFSSGNPDVASIRNFMKMLYDKASTPQNLPKYLLLFGDGSFDRKSTDKSKSNYIITYQSINSLNILGSYVTDDYFGLLDNQESVEGGLLDIGVGRFPVQDSITARGIINKIKRYYNQKSKGNWRNMLCFVADDDDSGGVEGNAHVMQADALTRYVSQNYANFNFDKIYIDAFEQTSTTSGQRYPDVNKAIYNRINQGALIMNYTGHGNENGWTSELILMKEDIINWNNTIYPVIITATCDFSRFDDYISQTAGEEAFLNQDGGGIALLSTTRLVYSAPNFTLNYEFYKNAFVKDSEGSPLALGEILRRTKNSTGYDTNKLNFTLLGDPAIKLPYPTNTVQTDSINGKIISNADTIRAFQQVKVSGSIIDKSGSLYNSFNGTIYPIIYDKTKKAATLSNDGVAPFNFIQQKDILFKGKATVNNGYFNFSFILPRDIDYNYDFGKISYYAMDSSTDASGNFTKIVIGGLSPTALTDNQGPKIGLFINDTTFINGGITNEYPTLLAKISDLNGINIGGHGIGHDLVAKLDNNSNNLFLLNNYYQTSMDNFQNGDVIFQLPKMDPGIHTISVKAWDINNNSAVSEISFKVLDGNAPIIEKVKCYPNPSNLSQESIYFFFEHNKNGEPLDITINIYDMTGSQVVTLQTNIQTSGFTSGPIQWDRTVGQPLPKGIYIYRITMNTKNGMVQSNAKKLIIIE